MKRLFLVRHGSAENPKRIVYRRLPGFHLSEMGKLEAAVAREALSNIPYEVIYHSPLERAFETAQIVNSRGVPFVPEDRINEWDEHEQSKDIVARVSDFWRQWQTSPVSTAVAVAHRDSIRILLLHLTKHADIHMPLNNLSVFPLPPAGIYEVTISESGIDIRPHFPSINLPPEFEKDLLILEDKYLSGGDPIRQSGFAGGDTRWRQEREVILEALDGNGDFLDLGCANGHLLECLIQWATDKGRELNPFGVDWSEKLVQNARSRFAGCDDNFFVGNCGSWRSTRKFKYVYTLFDCVPEHLFGFYVHRLLHEVVEPSGKLIIGSYGHVSKNIPARDLVYELRKRALPMTGSRTVGNLPATSIAWINNAGA